MIRQLGADEFSEREAACQALEAIGAPALNALDKARQSDKPEVRRRAIDVIKKIRSHERDKAWTALKKLGARVEGKVVTYAPKDEDFRDRDLEPLQWMDDLESLSVFAPITGTGLAPLEGCKNLAILTLCSSRVTDAGLVHLKGLNRLWFLSLPKAGITGAGLAHLKELSELEHLNLSETRVTDEGMIHLKEFRKLQSLSLAGTAVTDKGLTNLKGFSHLRMLDLRGLQVTDVGLHHLKELKSLEQLDLTETTVTRTGIADLKKNLPKLQEIRH